MECTAKLRQKILEAKRADTDKVTAAVAAGS